MVIDLLTFIADEIYSRNAYFDKYVAIARQTDDGRVYKYSNSDEKVYCGISDSDGIGFYVKVNPVVNFGLGRQLTSSKQISEGTLQCNLIAYQVNSDINILNWVDKLIESLKSVNFGDYTGSEKHVKIEIQSANISPEIIFRDETDKSFEWDASLKIVSIVYNVKYSQNKFDCSECNIFDIIYC